MSNASSFLSRTRDTAQTKSRNISHLRRGGCSWRAEPGDAGARCVIRPFFLLSMLMSNAGARMKRPRPDEMRSPPRRHAQPDAECTHHMPCARGCFLLPFVAHVERARPRPRQSASTPRRDAPPHETRSAHRARLAVIVSLAAVHAASMPAGDSAHIPATPRARDLAGALSAQAPQAVTCRIGGCRILAQRRVRSSRQAYRVKGAGLRSVRAHDARESTVRPSRRRYRAKPAQCSISVPNVSLHLVPYVSGTRPHPECPARASTYLPS
ncbi:hypothetical protein FB451DRAFT_1273192 [Mycena latifolia]|nr:hypothetical protein FB451DRAFT_1273192 [Mycena latifolia]